MAESESLSPQPDPSRMERLFPKLQPHQIERVAAHGTVRQIREGEILAEPGKPITRCFIIRTGQLEITRPSVTDEFRISMLGVGQFTGEASILAGQPGLVRIQVCKAGEVVQIEREQLLSLVQTDSELSDIFMRAFLLRRVEL